MDPTQNNPEIEDKTLSLMDHQLSHEQVKAFAQSVLDRLPEGGLFAGHEWRVGTEPFWLDEGKVSELENMGRILLSFYQALNRLYRASVEGKQPAWIAHWLELGKPEPVIQWQRSNRFKTAVPRVIRPDLLWTERGFRLTEMDSVPGGIGLTAWMQQVYGETFPTLIGGKDGMLKGFASIFDQATEAKILFSEEAATYQPEMEWLVDCWNRTGQAPNMKVESPGWHADKIENNSAVYRFFEMFDWEQMPEMGRLWDRAMNRELTVTPPPKTFLEEKMGMALFWNGRLEEYWIRELGQGFVRRLREWIPYTWLVDPAPMPPHAAIPELNLTDWDQLKKLSQKDRRFALKISGFSEEAWGSRGVYIGSDLSATEWSAAVDKALQGFESAPYILQRFENTELTPMRWWDFEAGTEKVDSGRARLCPYYFVEGAGDQAKAKWGGALATVCPADKKIIHGMSDATLIPAAMRPKI